MTSPKNNNSFALLILIFLHLIIFKSNDDPLSVKYDPQMRAEKIMPLTLMHRLLTHIITTVNLCLQTLNHLITGLRCCKYSLKCNLVNKTSSFIPHKIPPQRKLKGNHPSLLCDKNTRRVIDPNLLTFVKDINLKIKRSFLLFC